MILMKADAFAPPGGFFMIKFLPDRQTKKAATLTTRFDPNMEPNTNVGLVEFKNFEKVRGNV